MTYRIVKKSPSYYQVQSRSHGHWQGAEIHQSVESARASLDAREVEASIGVVVEEREIGE